MPDVALKQWPGLFTNVDPHDLPPGGAQVQTNLMCISPGKLEVRRGYQWFASSGGAGPVKSMFRYHSSQQGDKLFIHSGTRSTVYTDSGTDYLESSVSGRSCYMQSRKGWVVRINGVQRGTIYDGTRCWLLGQVAPDVKPTISTAYGSGDAYEDVTYTFAYRYRDVDGYCTNLSPLETVTTTSASGLFSWTVTLPTEAALDGTLRTVYIDLFRSLSNDPSVLYKVCSLACDVSTYTNDGASDAVLREAEALPMYFDDGQACANRFVPPPADRSSCVQYGDRYWYAVQQGTDLSTRNLVYWSYPDEPESVPAENAIEVAGEPADPDDITCLFTNTSALYVGKTRHLYRVHYASDPRYNAAVRLVASRGVLNQQCYDSHEGTIYALDQIGPWRLIGNQTDADFDIAIRNLWSDGTIDYTKGDSFFVAIDPNQAVVRYFVILTDSSATTPNRALCYSIRTQAWWWETYPISMAAKARYTVDGRYRTLVGGGSSILIMGEGYADALYSTGDGYESWYSNPVEYEYKSGVFELETPEPKNGLIPRKYIFLAFQPIDDPGGSESTALRVYNDHQTTAQNWAVTDDHTERGSQDYSIDLLADIWPDSTNPGIATIVLQRRSDLQSATHAFIAIGIHGHQYYNPHIFYELSVSGE